MPARESDVGAVRHEGHVDPAGDERCALGGSRPAEQPTKWRLFGFDEHVRGAARGLELSLLPLVVIVVDRERDHQVAWEIEPPWNLKRGRASAGRRMLSLERSGPRSRLPRIVHWGDQHSGRCTEREGRDGSAGDRGSIATGSKRSDDPVGMIGDPIDSPVGRGRESISVHHGAAPVSCERGIEAHCSGGGDTQLGASSLLSCE